MDNASQVAPTDVKRKPKVARPLRVKPEDVGRAVIKALGDFFGNEHDLKSFLLRFGGLNLSVPTSAIAEKVLLERRALKVLTVCPSTDTSRRLADHYGVPLRTVAKSFMFANHGLGLKEYRKQLAEAADGESANDRSNDSRENVAS